MPNNYIISDFSTHLPMECKLQKFDYIPQHMHNYFELSMIVSGNCNLQIDDQLYLLGPDDVFCANPHTIHELRGSHCVIVTILFDQTVFEQILPAPFHPQFFCNSTVSDNEAAFRRLRSLIAHIVKNNVDKLSGFELRDWAYIYNIMDVMYNHFRIRTSSAKDKKNYRYSLRIAEISQIIQQRYRENFTLNELAARIHLSVPYLSKFFSEYYGVNFLTYLNQFRLNHAVHELLNTDKTIDDIAADSGFPNNHAFVTAFKKEFDVLPSAYRRSQKTAATQKETVAEQHAYIAGLKKYLQDDPADRVVLPPRTRDITLALNGSSYPLRHTWRNVMTVGTAVDLLYADVQDMLRTIQSRIGFRYIKLNGIFSDELHVYNETASGEPVYNFAYIDKIFDFLHSQRLLPWLQLSYMPEKLAKYPNKRLFNANVSEPRSNDAWCALVTAFVRHIVSRYGLAQVKTWKFSLWNQPDTEKNMYGFDRTEDFYTFYRITRQCVKEICQDFEFCIPPTYYIVHDNYQNWYIDFLKWCRSHDCVPDCLNFTYYDTKVFSQPNNSRESFGFVYMMSLSENPDGLKDFVMQVLKERKTLRLDNIPVYLTEWNNTPSQQDLLNDTCFKSCYIVKNILENYDRLESFGYWSLTDLMSDAPLPETLYFGGLGLFTVNRIPKASFYAFCLLKQLGGRLLGRGDGYFVTKEEDSFQIILYHYEHFSHLYATGEKFDMTEHDRYTVFANSAPVEVHLTLTGLAQGDCDITETIVNRKHGSSFDQWIEMGAPEPGTAAESNYLKQISIPQYRRYKKAADENGVLSLTASLELLEVRLIVLRQNPPQNLTR